MEHEAKANGYNFLYAMTLMDLMHGIIIEEDDFVDLGHVFWKQIGNLYTSMHLVRYEIDENELTVDLPCGVESIEAVTTDDYYASGYSDIIYLDSINSTQRRNRNAYVSRSYDGATINTSHLSTNPIRPSGHYIEYELEGKNERIRFKEGMGGRTAYVLYKGLILDDDNLPFINIKEATAICDSVAYSTLRKRAIKGDVTAVNALQLMDLQSIHRSMASARVSEKFTQNEMDTILQTMTSYNRKRYHRSYKTF